jgi:hypothetical protein
MYVAITFDVEILSLFSCAARPLRDDEVLPVRQHRIVPSGAMATEEEEVSNQLNRRVDRFLRLSLIYMIVSPRRKRSERRKRR